MIMFIIVFIVLFIMLLILLIEKIAFICSMIKVIIVLMWIFLQTVGFKWLYVMFRFLCLKVIFVAFSCLLCISLSTFCIFTLLICSQSLGEDLIKPIVIVFIAVNISFIYPSFNKIVLTYHMIIEDLNIFFIVKYVNSSILDTINNNFAHKCFYV